MKINKKVAVIFMALIPVATLATTSYFNNKSSGCYATLSEIRYSIDNYNFNLSTIRQQINDIDNVLLKEAEKITELENSSSKINTLLPIEDLKNLISRIKDAGKNKEIIEENNLSLRREETDIRKKCNNYSNLATMFLYISLATSVIIPILKSRFLGKNSA